MRRAAALLLAARCDGLSTIAVPFACEVYAHASLTIPLGRNGGKPKDPSNYDASKYYTQGTNIPGKSVIGKHLVTEKRWNEQHHPWRAPGTAKVSGSGCGRYCDNCKKEGKDGADMEPKEKAKWTAGAAEEVAFGFNTNHGGGYSYRLCPASSKLTESCFQKGALDFVGDTTWVQDGKDTGKRTAIPATRTTAGAGMMWTMNPVPNCGKGDGKGSCPFKEPMKHLHGHVWNCGDKCIIGKVNLVDLVQVPASLAPGDYVLSWRWDCEETAQVWQNCGDVTVSAAGPAPAPTPAPAPLPPPGPAPPLPPAPPPSPHEAFARNKGDYWGTDGANATRVYDKGDHGPLDTCADRCLADAECGFFDYQDKGAHCRTYHGTPALVKSSDGYDAYAREAGWEEDV